MAVITAIVASPRREGRFVVDLDGRTGPVVSLDVITRLRISVGRELDEGAEAALRGESAMLETFDRALNMLASHPRSARDLRRRLVLKGEDPGHADAAIARLQAAGFVDDAAFARQLARSKVVGQGASKRRVQQELFKRGVPREVADEAVAQVLAEEDVDTRQVVIDVARRKLRTLEKLDEPTRRRRLYGFLARRGYEADDIRQAIARVLGGRSEPGDEEIAAGDEDE